MSTTLLRPQRNRPPRTRRALAGVISTALAAAGLTLVAAPTQADPAPAPALSWRVSQAMAEHLGTHTFTGGASEDANKVITFPEGKGYLDPNTGKASVSYSGTARLAFANAGTEYYYVSIGNPQITVDAAGNGKVTAEVGSALLLAFGGAQPSTIAPARVTVTTFNASKADWATTGGLSSLTKIPNWAGTIAAGSAEATAAGIPSGFPLSGKAFSPEFFNQIVTSAKSWFYVNGSDENSATNLKKNPAEFTASVGAAATTATIAQATPSTGLAVKVDGAGFSGAAPGVYVSFGEEGVFSDTNPSGYLTTNFLPNATISNGEFSTTLQLTPAQAAALSADKNYVVYTQKAHGTSVADPSQTTQTPIAIDVNAFVKKTPTVTLGSVTPIVVGNSTTITATVDNDATGNVTLEGLPNTITATIDNGNATFTVPSTVPAGSYSLVAKYAGDGDLNAADSAAKQLVVAKNVSGPTVSAPSSKVYGKTVPVTATVPSVNGVVPTGQLVLTGAGTETRALAGGKATFSVPATLAVGKRVLKVSYSGDTNYGASSNTATLTVTKDSVSISDKVTKKPTTKKSGKITVTVKAKSSKIKPTGKVTVYFKKSGQKTVKTSVGTLKNGVGSLSVKKLKKKGTWKVYVKYSAGTGYNSVSSKYVGTVKVAK